MSDGNAGPVGGPKSIRHGKLITQALMVLALLFVGTTARAQDSCSGSASGTVTQPYVEFMYQGAEYCGTSWQADPWLNYNTLVSVTYEFQAFSPNGTYISGTYDILITDLQNPELPFWPAFDIILDSPEPQNSWFDDPNDIFQVVPGASPLDPNQKETPCSQGGTCVASLEHHPGQYPKKQTALSGLSLLSEVFV